MNIIEWNILSNIVAVISPVIIVIITYTKTWSSLQVAIDGKLTWANVVKSPTYMKYADRALDILRSKGYYINEEGNCVIR